MAHEHLGCPPPISPKMIRHAVWLYVRFTLSYRDVEDLLAAVTCCFVASARPRSSCRERIFRSGLRVDQACLLRGGLVEPLCVAERRVELADWISDGGLQHHAVAELQHIDVTDRGDIVVDPFLGSGSTLIAANKTGRVCRGVELDPLYVDVIVRRFEAATGNQAVLVETGGTLEALATQGAGTGVGLRSAPAVADVADEPQWNGRLLPVKRAGACTAEVGGSNPLSSTK
jgi:DNA methylase